MSEYGQRGHNLHLTFFDRNNDACDYKLTQKILKRTTESLWVLNATGRFETPLHV